MADPFDEVAPMDNILVLILAWYVPAAEISGGFADAVDDFDFGIAAPFSETRQTRQGHTSVTQSVVRPITPRDPVILKPFIANDAPELCVSALNEIFRQRSGEGRSREFMNNEGVPAN
jgi:hypothetical protein